MEQITKDTTGTFDVVNRQTGHVVGEARINGGEFVSFTPAQLPAVVSDDELTDHLVDGGDIPDDAPVTCHKCGAVVDGDALDVQTAADGTPKLGSWMCRAHLVAFAERLKAAIREQREGGNGEA